MSQKDPEMERVELTPLEKIEALYAELLDWYGDADKKQQRTAAKFLMVALDKLAISEGNNWHHLVSEYIDILKHNPERFQKILQSNRGELKNKNPSDPLH